MGVRFYSSFVDEETAHCCRCEVEIPVDSRRCPVCHYCPAGRNPLVMRLGEYAFIAALLVSLGVFVAGVARLGPSVMSEIAVITPYTTGVSGFFTYYIHHKRRTSPTDDEVF